MKMKKIISSLLCCMITLSSAAMLAQAEEVANYSSVIPSSLKLEIFGGAYRSQWQVLKSQEGAAAFTERSMLATSSKNLQTTAKITSGIKGMSWYDKDNFITVGKYKNSMTVATFAQKNGDNRFAFDYLAASGIGLKNSDAQSGGFIAVVANNKLDYKNTYNWGGYSDTTDKDTSTNTILAGYDKGPTTLTAIYGQWGYGSTNRINAGGTVADAYYVVGLMAEENVDLDNTYITVYTTAVEGFNTTGTNGNHNARAVTGVPMSRYYSEADKGKYKEIVIPLTDFNAANDYVVSKFIDTSSAIADADTPAKPQPTFNGVIGTGLMKIYDENIVDPTENYMVYLAKSQFMKTAAPTGLYKSKFGANDTGYGEILKFTPSADNCVTGYEFSMKDADGNTLFTKTVSVDDEKLVKNDDGSYAYTIGVISPQNAVYSVSAVYGDLVGNDDIGFTPIKSAAATVVTGWDAGSSQYNPVGSMKYVVNGNSVVVLNRAFYDCKVIVARYDADGKTLKQYNEFKPLGEKCLLTYSDAIGTDLIKVFIWSDDDLYTPLVGAATKNNTNVVK